MRHLESMVSAVCQYDIPMSILCLPYLHNTRSIGSKLLLEFLVMQRRKLRLSCSRRF